MAPKAKKGKKAQDDWDEGLGEVADPIAQATADAKAEEVAAEEDADDNVGGGLMAAMRRNKEKRKKKGKAVDNDFLEGEDPTQSEDAPKVDLAQKAPVEASMDDEDVFGQPVKKSKAVKAQKDDDDEPAADGKIKTKAEKEKEKKEREKQRKKEQAAAKKKTAPVVQPKEEKVEVVVEEPKAEAPGKKKKLNPALAALQKQQEELRRRQEEDAKFAAEEKARLEADEKAAAEEEQRKIEQKAAKKERERKKIEEMKKAGTYKTEKQKRDEAQAKLRLQQMLESGTAKVEGADGETRKRDDRKRNPRKEAEERKAKEQEALELRLKEEQIKRLEEEAAKAKANAEAKKVEDDEESELDDWEAMAEKDEVEATKPAIVDAPQPAEDDEDEDEDEDDDSEDDSEDESDSEAEQETVTQRQARERKEQAHAKRQQEMEAAKAAASKDNLRSPIACILGHVDTGKTKLLDKIRQTNVQDGEAGGITQQIGATFFPVEAMRKKTEVVNQDGAFEFKIPGLLVIDTPGHESFTNLRSRGSSLCNIAILLHGLEPQTLESMKLLRDRRTPFIVALNKIDRLYGWQAKPNNGFRDSLAAQNNAVKQEFKTRLEQTKLAFAEKGFNSELYYENKSMAKNVSLVPTSAHTGEGIPDMLKLVAMLTQERMTGQLMYLSEISATVLEVKIVEGLGTTIDVILSNGILNEGDTCVICGTNGPIRFQIRAILTPGEMKELRVKSNYVHHKTVKAALGVKLTGTGLDNAIAGSRLLVAKDPNDEDELEDLEDDIMSDLDSLSKAVSKTGRGVFVQASTLGSLEALLEFLRVSKIPVGNIGIGNVYKRDVIQASTMLEKAPEYAVMLCFDVKIDREAQELADAQGVKILSAMIIYHLFDGFTAHMKQIAEKKKEESKSLAVFPCVLKPVAVFNKTSPIVIGCDCTAGTLRIGTPLAAVKINPETKAKEFITLGRVTSIERDHKAVPVFKMNTPSVAIKIEGASQPSYGRHLEESDTLYSMISRKSIDVLKESFRDEVTKEDWTLIAKHLKPLFDIS
ncbi:hypothetical protein AMS68_006638 [Peltaster fructicola]|uniref:Eukaryotic translation initiation factor 5B n=1 Tax=Peltaster fructicola TaxID=286661 RepID=A0A6H0Y2H8_9PEZI|nr:hypothetical protein AMS68_006638 [Peltaster fructicola]